MLPEVGGSQPIECVSALVFPAAPERQFEYFHAPARDHRFNDRFARRGIPVPVASTPTGTAAGFLFVVIIAGVHLQAGRMVHPTQLREHGVERRLIVTGPEETALFV